MVQSIYAPLARPRSYYHSPYVPMPRLKEFDPEQVLDRALDLFWRRGYAGASLRDLLDRMQISRQSLYDTFGDKHSLFLKVLARYEELSMGNLIKLLELDAIPSYRLATDPEARESTARYVRSPAALRGFFETYLAEVVLDPERGSCLMANTAIEVGPTDPEIHAIVRAYFLRIEESIHALLVDAVEAGELDDERSPRSIARHLLNTFYGLGVMGRAGASRAALRQMIDVGLSVLDELDA